jgi:hypothetical protein
LCHALITRTEGLLIELLSICAHYQFCGHILRGRALASDVECDLPGGPVVCNIKSRHVEKELVVRISVPSTPKGRALKMAAAVKARMPVVGRMVVCICIMQA